LLGGVLLEQGLENVATTWEIHSQTQMDDVAASNRIILFNKAQQQQLGQARGAGEEKSQSDDAKDRDRTNGGLVKDQPATGPGTVPPDQRDSKRVWTKAERQQKLDQQNGKCAHCGKDKTVDQTNGHHKKRHANGGKTNDPNHAEVCKKCHKELTDA